MNYYNENDPKAAAWLRELITWGQIPDGEVDDRSIVDVRPSDLAGYSQCHFFAGIGGWSLALRLAGWDDSRPVWTGSCPCQPFSAAGKGAGFDDERHLWPSWHWLIRQCRPDAIFGEQVATALQWWDLVSTDLEVEGYTTGAAIIGAHSVGAPHIRQRLYWMADASGHGQQLNAQRHSESFTGSESPRGADAARRRESSGVGDTSSARGGRDAGSILGAESSIERGLRGQLDESIAAGAAGLVADSESEQPHGHRNAGLGRRQPADGGILGLADSDIARSQGWRERWASTYQRPTWAHGMVDCRDGKQRPVEPGTFPLAHGVPGRVGLLRGYGNAIVPEAAAEFIGACA